MAAVNHPVKKSDARANERTLEQRQAQAKRQEKYEDELRRKSADIERRKELFQNIVKFVSQEGGWVVSPPGIREIRIEIPKNSPLPVKLAELGYTVRHCSTRTRLQNGSFVPVDIIAITLGS